MAADQGGAKSPLYSKTIHFNLANLLVAAFWPLLPEDFRSQDWAFSAVLAWVTLGNLVLRFLTCKALHIRGPFEDDAGKPS